jgi:hypothetical protein
MIRPARPTLAEVPLADLSFLQLSRPGFQVVFHDTLEDFYLAEALEYITAWRQARADDPVGICGPAMIIRQSTSMFAGAGVKQSSLSSGKWNCVNQSV